MTKYDSMFDLSCYFPEFDFGKHMNTYNNSNTLFMLFIVCLKLDLDPEGGWTRCIKATPDFGKDNGYFELLQPSTASTELL